MSVTRARTAKKSKPLKQRKAKVKKAYNQDRYIIPALRKIWRFYPFRREVLNESNDGRGFHKCYVCGNKYKDVQVDHIDPVGTCKRPDGRTDYNLFIDRLLCSKDNLGVICKTCHALKSKQENEERRKIRAAAKSKKNSKI